MQDFTKQVYHLTNPIFIITPKTARFIKDIKFEIDKAGIFNCDKYSVWRDYDIFEALLIGLDRINSSFPFGPSVTYSSIGRVPTIMIYYLCQAHYMKYINHG